MKVQAKWPIMMMMITMIITSSDEEKYEDAPGTLSLRRTDKHPNGPITSSTLKHLDTFGLILAQFALTHPPKPMQASM